MNLIASTLMFLASRRSKLLVFFKRSVNEEVISYLLTVNQFICVLDAPISSL